MTFTPNRVELIEKNSESKAYRDNVNSLFSLPKLKDEYEQNYDMGKVKKRKLKKEYIQPNYNEVYEKLKSIPAIAPIEKQKKIQKKNKPLSRPNADL